MKIISKETVLANRRMGEHVVNVAFRAPSGEMQTATLKINNGQAEVLNFNGPIGEMITTPAGLDALVKKTVVDLQLGRESIPLLYGPIYRTIVDPNFTKNVDIKPFINTSVVFLEVLEGGEVQFGSRKVGPTDTVPILTHAAGLEWTEDMVMYDQTWEMAEASRAFGESYNKLLNHLHFSPILSYVYAAKNKTAANATGATYKEKLRETIRAGLIHAASDKNADTGATRKPNILLAHSSKRWDLEESLGRMVINGTEYPAISNIDTMIFYDGESVTVGEKTYNYSGVDPTKAYLIEGQKYFRELVKHDLMIDANGADISRLIEDQQVGRTRRGVIAGVANAVEELTLP